MATIEHTGGLIRNRRHAIVAVICTAIVAASRLRTTLKPVRFHSRWLFEPINGLPHLKPLFIGLSLFCWAFVLWIVFWFYRAARGKYERFMLGAFTIAFVLTIIEGFMPPVFAANIQFVSTGAAFVSFAAAMTLLFISPTKDTTSQ
jgi:hypothetical protein